MSLVSLKQILDHAAENNYGIPAFNISNLEQITAVVEAANEVNSPVIIQTSTSAKKYAGNKFIKNLILAAISEYNHLPICIHQDHGTSLEICQGSIQMGYSSVMMDGSLKTDGKTPSDIEYNTNITKKIVEIAHACGVSVEGELGCLGSLETGKAEKEDGIGAEGILSKDQLLTDPQESETFVKNTNVDALAIAIGTSHGAYKFQNPPSGATLDILRIKNINLKIPNTHLVMHGASSVPQKWIKIINNNGGEIKKTYGVPIKEIQEAIKHGVRKINIDTDLRIASTAALREFLKKNKKDFDPRKYNQASKNAMKEICKERYISFGSANMAKKIKRHHSLETMAKKYQK